MKLPRVHRIVRGGTVYKYHRRTRKELPRNVPEDHQIFLAAWMEEEAKCPLKTSKAAPGSIAHGCEEYLASRSYKDLSESYAPVIRRHVEAIKAQGGSAPMARLETRHVEQDIEPLTPAVARSRLKAWRKLAPFWKAKGHIASDFAKGATGKRMPRTDGHTEWSSDDLEVFRAFWPLGAPQRLAGEILQWLGARCVDAVRVGPVMVQRDGHLHFVQRKTKAEVYVPWDYAPSGLEHDFAMLTAALARIDSRHLVFIITRDGKPRSKKAFSGWFSEACTDAGLPNLSAHGLRKYRMNALAEAGKSVLQMQAWVGHATLSEVEAYTRRAKRRAAFAGERTENPVKQDAEGRN